MFEAYITGTFPSKNNGRDHEVSFSLLYVFSQNTALT